MASRAKFRVQHIAVKPRGWRVRTKREGAHELRIGFPPGPRRRGTGKLLEILHPKAEHNPCAIEQMNPAELVIFGNPRKRQRNQGEGAPGHKPGCPCRICENMRGAAGRVPNAGSVYSKAVSLGYPYARGDGKTARDGQMWLWRFTKNSDGSGGHIFVGWNQDQKKWVRENLSRRGAAPNPARRRNQGETTSETEQAVSLYQTFHGKDPSGVIEKQVSAAMRLDYTALGKLDYLRIKPDGAAAQELQFENDGVTLASSPDGQQLYLIGGRQTLDAEILKAFTDDTSKDLLDLGEARQVQYIAQKAPDFQTVRYYHKFGEESAGSEMPRVIYDAIRKQIFLAGGEYHVAAPGIIN